MTNPNPARITTPVWRLWTERPVTAWLLGGIYANKRGYHNTRDANQLSWPGNYSVVLPLDLQGPGDKAAAIDYTMSDAEMRRRTGYLRDAVDRRDPRLSAVREFYGTLNSTTVFGRIKDSRDGTWRASSADSSHLWHIHISIFRAYLNVWTELEPILSVLAGEALEAWEGRQSGPGTGSQVPSGNPPLRVTSPITQNARVGSLQLVLNEIGEELTVDNSYTSTVADAVSRFQAAVGLTVDGIYGVQSEQALRQIVEEDMPITQSDLQSIAEAVWGYRQPWSTTWVRDGWGLREDGWLSLALQQSSYGFSRRSSEQTARVTELAEAILAAVTGGNQAQIMAAIDAHHEEQVAALERSAEHLVAERGELRSLVEKSQRGEVPPEVAVTTIAQRLSASD